MTKQLCWETGRSVFRVFVCAAGSAQNTLRRFWGLLSGSPRSARIGAFFVVDGFYANGTSLSTYPCRCGATSSPTTVLMLLLAILMRSSIKAVHTHREIILLCPLFVLLTQHHKHYDERQPHIVGGPRGAELLHSVQQQHNLVMMLVKSQLFNKDF